MTKSNPLVYLIIIATFLNACNTITGEEIARIPVNAVSTNNNIILKEVTLDLKKGDEIIFWSDMDLEYEGDVDLRFRIQFMKDGKEFGGLEIDPLKKNLTIGETKLTLQNKTTWRFTGRNTKVQIEDDAKYTFKALLASSDNPTLKINKAEIIIKK
jgi:hypothetical protein